MSCSFFCTRVKKAMQRAMLKIKTNQSGKTGDRRHSIAEYLDIVDENGIPTGETVEYETAHAKGFRHRTRA